MCIAICMLARRCACALAHFEWSSHFVYQPTERSVFAVKAHNLPIEWAETHREMPCHRLRGEILAEYLASLFRQDCTVRHELRRMRKAHLQPHGVAGVRFLGTL